MTPAAAPDAFQVYFFDPGGRPRRATREFIDLPPFDPDNKPDAEHFVVISYHPKPDWLRWKRKHLMVEVYSSQRYDGRLPAAQHHTNDPAYAAKLARQYAASDLTIPREVFAGPR